MAHCTAEDGDHVTLHDREIHTARGLRRRAHRRRRGRPSASRTGDGPGRRKAGSALRYEPHAANDPGAPEDDWLAGEEGLDWGDSRQGRRPPPVDASSAVDASWSEGPPAPEPAHERPSSRPSTRETIVRRRRIVALGAVGLIAVAAVGVAVTATRDGGTTSQAPVPTDTLPATTTTPVSPPTSTTPEAEAPTTTTETQPASPAPTVTLPASGKLKVGDTGAEVVALQQALALLELPVGEADGRFGAATRDAVIAFQTAQGLTPDGIVGAATAQALNEALAASEPG